jgi:hypothetical protein
MRDKLISTTLTGWVLLGFIFAATGGTNARAAGLKLEVQLLWGTNDEKSPDPKHRPVEPDVQKKLNELPLKFTHYFMVNKSAFEVPAGGTKKEPISEKCAIEVKDLGQSKVEVSLFGKGQQVVNRTQSLPKGETLVLGGNAPNSTAWLVVLKRIE